MHTANALFAICLQIAQLFPPQPLASLLSIMHMTLGTEYIDTVRCPGAILGVPAKIRLAQRWVDAEDRRARDDGAVWSTTHQGTGAERRQEAVSRARAMMERREKGREEEMAREGNDG